MISILQLGALDYATGLRLQQKLVDLRKNGRIPDVLLLLEHTPVITLGRNAKKANILASSEMLVQRGVEVIECDRGGDVTFHGPGQIVGYPIFDLRGLSSADSERKTLGAVEYVRRLEEVLIRSCTDFGIVAKRISGLTGVWTDHRSLSFRAQREDSRANFPAESRNLLSETHSEPSEAKLAAIGVHISRSVTSHGFALNVNNELDYFNLIVPCGITSKPVTSMSRELGKPLPLQEVAHSISRHFGVVFQSQMLWLENLDSLLHPIGVPVKIPPELRELRGEEESFLA